MLEPLLDLARHANDATRLSALAAVELIALNLPQAADRVAALGGADLREGLRRHGSLTLTLTLTLTRTRTPTLTLTPTLTPTLTLTPTRHGSPSLRHMAAEALALPSATRRVAVDANAHARQAKAARRRHSALGAGRGGGVRRAFLPPEAEGLAEQRGSVLPYSMLGTE